MNSMFWSNAAFDQCDEGDTPMQIWVDADACPRVIKDILYRAADRKKVQLTLVANQPMHTPSSAYISSMVVGAGFDVASGAEMSQVLKLGARADRIIFANTIKSVGC